MSAGILRKRVVMQTKGISAKHPIVLLERSKDIIVCSIASKDGNSNFDYSIIMKKGSVSLDGPDEEVVSQICQTQNHVESSWGFTLALSNGLTREELDTLYPLIKIHPESRIRVSKVTKH
ncbi:MAG: hypothetical protein ACXAEU_05850 [Candidatus Hodarchaeales archaeon]|jgi:hypothetical protein